MNEKHNEIQVIECPDCDSPMTNGWRNHTFPCRVGEDSVNLSVNVPMHFCSSCNLSLIGEDGERLKHEAVCRHLGLLTPTEIRAIRHRRHLTRQEFASVTGLGAASLGRWERGAGFQSQANDRYLRLLDESEVFSRLSEVADSIQRSLERTATGKEKIDRSKFRLLEVSANTLRAQQHFELIPHAA